MQELQIFKYAEKEVRTVSIDGEPWWVAKDVCDILELSDVSKAVSRLDDDEKGTNQILTLRGEQNLIIINESGLYSLIIRSDKPEAKPFKKWITSEVLPSIRKTGSYAIANNQPMPDIKHLTQQLDLMSKEIKSFKKLLSGKKGFSDFEEIKSLFNVIEYSKEQQYIIVEHSGSLFLVNTVNYFTIHVKEKRDGVWENNWHYVKNGFGSMKKSLEYLLEMY